MGSKIELEVLRQSVKEDQAGEERVFQLFAKKQGRVTGDSVLEECQIIRNF